MRRAISFLAIILALLVLMQPALAGGSFSQGLSAGSSAGEYANQRLGSKSALKSNILTPASSGGAIQMHSLNGQNPFNGSISNPKGKRILEILIHPTSTGDLSPVYVYENTGSGNQYNYSYTVPFEVSGICANGLISCEPGTWKNCKYYKWVADSSGRVSLEERPSTDFGGCYCINNSCGYNLATNNLSIVLKDIGGGAIGAVMQSGNYKMTVTGVDVNSVDIVYYGQIIRDNSTPQPSSYPSTEQAQYEWQTGSTNPSSYYSGTNGGYLFAAAGSVENSEKSNPDSMYNLIATSGAAKKNPVEQKTCYIKREINITKHQNDYFSAEGDDTCPEKFDTSICSKIDQCYSDSTGYHCLCELSSNGSVSSGGCGPTYNYNVCGKIYVNFYVCDDPCVSLKLGSKSILSDAGGCYISDGANPDNGTYTLITEGTENLYLYLENMGACECPPDHPSWSKVYIPIYRKAWDTVNNEISDQCQQYENNSNCQLKDEWVDGVRTWKDYASTGLVPVGQVCKTFYGWTSHTFCYNWWTKERIYTCKTSGYNFDKAKQRVTTIVNSTANANVMSTSTLGEVNYQDYRESNGSWGYHNGSLTIPLSGSKNGCMFVCKVKVPVQDTQAYSNTNTSQYRSIQSYSFDYRKCTDTDGTYTCPYDPSKGETIVTNCQCINEFAEAAAIMQTLENAGKDIICSSGVKH